MKVLAIAALAVLLLSGCQKPATPNAGIPDYTIVGKSVYLASSNGGAGKLGSYASIVINGQVSEVWVGFIHDGYEFAHPCGPVVVGKLLPETCR